MCWICIFCTFPHVWNLGKPDILLIESQAHGCSNSYIWGGTALSRISEAIIWMGNSVHWFSSSDVTLLDWLKQRKYNTKEFPWVDLNQWFIRFQYHVHLIEHGANHLSQAHLIGTKNRKNIKQKRRKQKDNVKGIFELISKKWNPWQMSLHTSSHSFPSLIHPSSFEVDGNKYIFTT